MTAYTRTDPSTTCPTPCQTNSHLSWRDLFEGWRLFNEDLTDTDVHIRQTTLAFSP